MSGSLVRGLALMRGIQELYLDATEPHAFAASACELIGRTGGFPRVEFSMRDSSGSNCEGAWSRAAAGVLVLAAFPVQTGNSDGVLTITAGEESELDASGREDLQGIAHALARSIETLVRRRADAAGARRLRRMRERLDAISRSIERSASGTAALQRDLLREVAHDLDAGIACLGYVTDDGEAEFVHVYPADAAGEYPSRGRIDGTLVAWIVERGEDAAGLVSLGANQRFRRLDPLHTEATQSFAGAAFAVDGRRWFVALAGDRERAPFQPDELDYIRTVASYFRMSCLQERVKRLQFFDEATGLPNHAMLTRRIEELIERQPGRSFFVLAVAPDDFWAVARTWGAREADAVLKDLGSALQAAAREHVVFRGKGETFTVLCPAIDDDVRADELGRALAYAARGQLSSFTSSSISIGAAAYLRDGNTAEEIDAALNQALAEARSDDRPDLIFRSLPSDSIVSEHRTLHRELEQALRNDEFVLHYQPYSSLVTGQFVGAEALLRWESPARGTVMPDEFIPLAERTGLIEEIGAWVMREATRTAAQWQRHGDFEIAVNVSAMQVTPRLVTLIRDAAGAAHLDTDRIVIEITESTAMDKGDVVGVLHRCHGLGVRVAIDDFGTGYSSLAYLKQLPVDIVKLDRSFVGGLPGDPFDAAIAAAVIAMGTRFGSVVLAEGVENDAQLEWLRRAGCTLAQGFFIARPMGADEIARVLASEVA